MHRQFSQQPFLRHYSHSTNPFLDLLDIEEANPTSRTTSGTPNSGPDPTISVNVSPEALPLLVRVLRENKRVKQLGTLHTVTFVTVDDYLFLLRGIAGVLGEVDGLGRKVMYYLAAAVSDFFLPRQKMVSSLLLAHYPHCEPVSLSTDWCSSRPSIRSSRERGRYISRWIKSLRY
jgi:phosphopantothenate-cysteine ligase